MRTGWRSQIATLVVEAILCEVSRVQASPAVIPVLHIVLGVFNEETRVYGCKLKLLVTTILADSASPLGRAQDASGSHTPVRSTVPNRACDQHGYDGESAPQCDQGPIACRPRLLVRDGSIAECYSRNLLNSAVRH